MSESMNHRQRILLAWMSSSPSPYIDPIRVMKGMFLITMETPDDWLSVADKYEFEPYNWGPFSKDVYSDLEVLRGFGYVSVQAHSGRSWNTYALTKAGQQAAAEVSDSLDPRLMKYIDSVSQFVINRGFSDLLNAVYKRYPQYATRSLFGGDAHA